MKVWRRRVCLFLILTILPTLLTGCLLTMLHVVTTGNGGQIAYGETVWGEVADNFGQEWSFFGRTGDVITITMSSSEFDTYLELYGPSYRRWYRRNNDVEENNTNSRIAKYKLPHTGDYVIVAVGRSSGISGTYSLALQSPAKMSSRPLCNVSAYYVGMATRPGTVDALPIRILRQNAQLRTLTRNAEATWIEVIVEGSRERGWVTTNPNYVICDRDINELPIDFMSAEAITSR